MWKRLENMKFCFFPLYRLQESRHVYKRQNAVKATLIIILWESFDLAREKIKYAHQYQGT